MTSDSYSKHRTRMGSWLLFQNGPWESWRGKRGLREATNKKRKRNEGRREDGKEEDEGPEDGEEERKDRGGRGRGGRNKELKAVLN